MTSPTVVDEPVLSLVISLFGSVNFPVKTLPGLVNRLTWADFIPASLPSATLRARGGGGVTGRVRWRAGGGVT